MFTLPAIINFLKEVLKRWYLIVIGLALAVCVWFYIQNKYKESQIEKLNQTIEEKDLQEYRYLQTIKEMQNLIKDRENQLKYKDEQIKLMESLQEKVKEMEALYFNRAEENKKAVDKLEKENDWGDVINQINTCFDNRSADTDSQ